MLTVAYCRVSTEEQAQEGYSIDGQANRPRAYAELHDLGEVLIISDPGKFGKDLNRPGLQQVLEMADRGHVGHVLVWRLDRLSRNLGDLIGLADRFGQKDVSLHSFTEKLDLSSATGRMFYNILGSFAQFYREQLSENIRMGNAQAIRQGKWINRPKTGYDLVDGELVPNGDAVLIPEIFRLRAQGLSHQRIEDRTGVKFSTARLILTSRIYLGEVLHNGEWYPGHHQPLITQVEFDAAQRAASPAGPGSVASCSQDGSAADCVTGSPRLSTGRTGHRSSDASTGGRAVRCRAATPPSSSRHGCCACDCSAPTKHSGRPSGRNWRRRGGRATRRGADPETRQRHRGPWGASRPSGASSWSSTTRTRSMLTSSRPRTHGCGSDSRSRHPKPSSGNGSSASRTTCRLASRRSPRFWRT